MCVHGPDVRQLRRILRRTRSATSNASLMSRELLRRPTFFRFGPNCPGTATTPPCLLELIQELRKTNGTFAPLHNLLLCVRLGSVSIGKDKPSTVGWGEDGFGLKIFKG